MSRAMEFDEFCEVANRVAYHRKQAFQEGGLMGALEGMPAPALGALLGGGAGLVTGAFSDKPGSMLRHGLVGAGLGGLAGYGAPKLMDMFGQDGQGAQTPGIPLHRQLDGSGIDAFAPDAQTPAQNTQFRQPTSPTPPATTWEGQPGAKADWQFGDPATSGRNLAGATW